MNVLNPRTTGLPWRLMEEIEHTHCCHRDVCCRCDKAILPTYPMRIVARHDDGTETPQSGVRQVTLAEADLWLESARRYAVPYEQTLVLQNMDVIGRRNNGRQKGT